MASKLKISIEAEVAKARAELETIRNSIDKMKDSQSKANNTFSNFLKGGKFLVGAKLAYEAVKKITKAVKEMVEAYRETELANARLSGILRATGRATEFAGNQMGQMADELARLSTFTTTEITNAQALLLAYDNIGNDTFPDVLKSAMDLSAAFGTDLNSSIQKLGKALNNPTTGFGELTDAGVVLSKEKEDLIHTLVEENKMYEAQKVLLDELKDRYGGLSEEIGKTAISKVDRLKDTLEDIKGEFGRKLLSDADEWINLGTRMAEGFLEKVKRTNDLAEIQHTEKPADFPEEEFFRPHKDKSLDLILERRENIYKKLENLKRLGIEYKPVFQSEEDWLHDFLKVHADDWLLYTQLGEELSLRQGDAKQAWQELQNQKKLDTANAKTASQAEQRRTAPSTLQEEKTQMGVTGLLKNTKDYLNDPTLFNMLIDSLEDFGGKQYEIFNLELENEKIQEIQNEIDKYIELIGDSKAITEKDWAYIEMAQQGLEQSLEENKNKIKELSGETDKWDEALDFITENQNLITISLEEQIKKLEEELFINTELLNDEEAKNKLTTEQLDALQKIVESKNEQLQNLKDEVSGLKEARDFIAQNKYLIEGQNEEKIKAIDAQIDYNTELLNTVDLTEQERKELERILGLLKQQKKEAEGGGFGEKTWGSIVSDWGKDSAYGDFISKLTTEINALEQAFGSTFNTIQGLAVSLGDAILDSMRTALTEIEKTLREKTELYEEKEREERGIRDESLNALQEQYDADAISYEEFMNRKQEIDDLYNENTKEALEAMNEAEEEATKKRDELARKEFEANKRNSIANALINGAMAVVRAFSDLGPIAGAIAGATIGALTTAQVAIIGQQSYVPALAEGGVATGPTLSMIGEGNEPELVLPLSKAKQFGFGGGGQQIIVKVENNTIYGIDDFGERAYEAIRSAQRVGRVPRNAF